MKALKNGVVIICVLVSTFVFISCEKIPGEGGNARIRGKVWVKQYDPYFTYLISQYFGANESVLITYGDNISPDKTIETNANGEFEFQYMRKGKYKITIYSHTLRDSIHPEGVIPIDTIVTIEKSKQIIDIGTKTIQK